ncbi:MAG TPA: DUF1294 domain-containing protein [Saliniramus sp.]|nr:DUF1294 domain-containing protein [Saliniramus sp.]
MYQVQSVYSPYLVLAIAVAALNGASFAAFAWDKWCAQNGGWRVPERTLLGLAAMGGSIGAVFGQIFLRHKTRKEPFRTHLRLIVGLQTFVLIIFLVPQSRNAALAFLQ